MTHIPGPAISLDKIQATAPGLVSLAKSAAISLDKKGLTGERAAVYLVLDHSGSMQGFYTDGSVQNLAERALGLSTNLDNDGIVPVVYFSDLAEDPIDVALTSYQGIIDSTHRNLRWGYTDYASAIDAVVAHYLASDATDPALVIFQTDGKPYSRTSDAKKAAERALKDASKHGLFFAFVGFGDPDSSEFDFLKKLDDLRVGFGGRKVDNASFYPAGISPRTTSNDELYDGIVHEYPAWLKAARAAGILR